MKKIVDSRGFACPLPVIQMEAALRGVSTGETVLVIADDPIAAIDIPHSCHEGGHIAQKLAISELIALVKTNNIHINKGPTPLDQSNVCVFLVTAG